jgi:hypothetical protein
MRRPTARSTRRRAARAARRAPGRPWPTTLGRALARALASTPERRALTGQLCALALLAGLAVALSAHAPPARAAGANAGRPIAAGRALGRALPPADPPVHARWSDPADQTAYAVQVRTTGRTLAGTFAFLLPNGDQIQGLVPLQPQPDGTSTQQASSGAGTCASGLLAAASSQAAPQAPVTVVAKGGTAAGTPVVFALSARIGPDALAAYAALSYAQAGDAAGVARVCAPGPFDFQMTSGCTATQCTDLLATAGPSVAKHNASVVHGAHARTAAGWQDAYNATSRLITAQYTLQQYYTALDAQERAKGVITGISPSGGPPQVEYDAAGQAYYQLAETVTLDHNGTVTHQHVTAYYVLEGGNWMFWFTA